MRNTYKLYFSAGKEKMKVVSEMYAETDKEIIEETIKQMQLLLNSDSKGNVTCHFMAMQDYRIVCDFTF